MHLTHLRTNHMKNPLGLLMNRATLSFTAEDTPSKELVSVRVEAAKDEAFTEVLYDSGEVSDISPAAFVLPVALEECTRYYWRVSAQGDAGDRAVSETAWFETPLRSAFTAQFITPDADKEQQAAVYTDVTVTKPVARGRVYALGLGLYELYIDGEKQGDECLLPGFVDYDSRLPFQTFEVEISEGTHRIELLLGNGWYKGRYGLRKPTENYGERLAAIAELHLWYADGTKDVIGTDETWKARPSQIVKNGIYPGEVWDTTVDTSVSFGVRRAAVDPTKLVPRSNPKLRVQKRVPAVSLIRTPAGEDVLDFGQNLVGWVEFQTSAPAGTEIKLQASEILQDGNFYRDNLRTADAEFTYISDGQAHLVRQHFTFYGFRYMKVSGWPGQIDPADFTALAIYSEMDEIGFIETSDELVNKLFENTKWGQRGNFLDIPTDCPQRDERCGWTGDAQVFSGTACYNMDAYAFYAKYGRDISDEQKKYGGGVPDTVPVAGNQSAISTVWGEAATVIPWNVYLHYGDPAILEQQYDSMKAWVDYMHAEDELHGGRHLWLTGFHYGDWLALDGKVNNGVYGATDPFYIASAYYHYSTWILSRAAAVLGYAEDAESYGALAQAIRKAFIAEYYTSTGRLAIDTMTAYVVALQFSLFPDGAEERLRAGLLEKLRKNRYHLETGFVGTPFLCRVLSEHGMNALAYRLLLEKGYPGWLYEVLMGATTVWERWDSVLPDGRISGTEMNSLNHYSYGSIVEWMYRDMLGIVPLEDGAGFKHFRVAPRPDYQIRRAKGRLRTPFGEMASAWHIADDGSLDIDVTVPVGTACDLVLPNADAESVTADVTNAAADSAAASTANTAADSAAAKAAESTAAVSGLTFTQEGADAVAVLRAGSYHVHYAPTVPLRKIYSLDSPTGELMENPKTRAILDEGFFSEYTTLPFFDQLCTFRETMNTPFMRVDYDRQEEMDRKLREVE